MVIALATTVMSMRVNKAVTLTPKGGEIPNSEFIARFAVDEGSNFHASVRVKLESVHDPTMNFPLFIYFIDDEDWESVLHSGDCSRASRVAKYQIEQNLRGDGEWSRWDAVEEQNLPTSRVWYAIASDCAGVTHQGYPSLPKIEVDLHMLNSGSEFSNEDKGVVPLNLILFVVYLYFLASTTFHVVKTALGKDFIEYPIMG